MDLAFTQNPKWFGYFNKAWSEDEIMGIHLNLTLKYIHVGVGGDI